MSGETTRGREYRRVEIIEHEDGFRSVQHVDATAEVERLRDALEEIISGPDASKGEDYGCLDLHEARTIAREALSGSSVSGETRS